MRCWRFPAGSIGGNVGPSVPMYLTAVHGRPRPAGSSGPLDGAAGGAFTSRCGGIFCRR